MQKFRTAFSSITGRRDKNEDNCAVMQFGRNTFFLAVADGMGGVSGGDIASSIALEAIENYLRMAFANNPKPEELKSIIAKSYNLAQERLADEVKRVPELKGMGTTLTAILIYNDNYVWANIGDSRIYLLSGGTMQQITEDHSYIQDYLNKSSDKLPEHIICQYGNVLTRVLDGGVDKPDIFPENDSYNKLNEGDLFLLCSDGLIIDKTEDLKMVFKDFIDNKKSIEKIAGNLVEWAFNKGSQDNISVIIGSAGSIRKVQKQESAHKTIVIKKQQE